MLKDRIIELNEKNSYYIFEEVDYNNKKYILTSECDINKDLLNDEELLVMEVVTDNDDLCVKRIEDDNLAKTVTALLIEKNQRVQ